MLKVDDYGRIRRAAVRDDMSIRAIARTFGHSRKTVRKALAQAEPSRYTLSQPRASPLLEPVRAIIDQICADDEHAPPKQRHTAMQIYRRLVAEHGFTGGYDVVRRYLARSRSAQQDTYIPLSHPPGERLECDFGHIYVDFPDKRAQVPVLLCTWCHSNAPFAMALPTERTEAVLAGMVAAFEFFGCVPREVWWDNPKTIVQTILTGRQRLFTERWLALSSYYCCEPRACMPGKGNEKGTVENRVKDLQRRFATPVPSVTGLAQLNEQLAAWCLADRQRTLRDRGASIGQRFEADQAAALALPATPFAAVVYQPAVVDSTQRVRYDNVYYSVPRGALGRTVTVRAGIDRVQVFDGARQLAEHPRCYERGTQVCDPLHYLPTLVRRPSDLDHTDIYRDWLLPAAFAQLRDALELRHGERAGLRLFIGVLQLLVEHSLDDVTRVVRHAVARANFDTGAIRLALERHCRPAREPGPLASLAQVEVPLPDLRLFDQLLRQGEPSHA